MLLRAWEAHASLPEGMLTNLGNGVRPSWEGMNVPCIGEGEGIADDPWCAYGEFMA